MITAVKIWMFLLAMTLPEYYAKIIKDPPGADFTETSKTIVGIEPNALDHCLSRLESALGSVTTRRISNANMIDLTGYALHQPLKSVPFDMYVTDMRVKIPGPDDWAKVDKCRFDPSTKILQAKVLFRDLVVSASVKLGGEERGGKDGKDKRNKCNMTLRLRHAGLGFVAAPQSVDKGAIGIRTSATFVDPNFISVHAYNCPSPVDGYDQERSGSGYGYGTYNREGPEWRLPTNDDVNQEMEDVFLRGIRTLITKYMEKQLQPALKDTLMMNLGYIVSYG